jgi:hypothetical protein
VPLRANVPPGQLNVPVQELEVSPVVAPYLPAAHMAQTVSLDEFEDEAPVRAYAPAGQVSVPVQAADSEVSPDKTPNLPAGQRVHVADPAVEKEPAGQGPEHWSVAPVPYRPAAHGPEHWLVAPVP